MKNQISDAAIAAINDEIARQDHLKAAGKFKRTCAEMRDGDTLIVVLEELGEVAEDLKTGNREHMRQEILEVITCLVRWYDRGLSNGYPVQFSQTISAEIRDELITLSQRARHAQEIPDAA